jgi:hypothetical protein
MFVPAFNGFRSLYVDWDGKEKISTPNVIQNLFPLLLPSLPVDLIQALVEEVPVIRAANNCASFFVSQAFAGS